MQRYISKVCILISFIISASLDAQNMNDIAKVNVDDLSDAQIEAYLKRAEDSGMTLQQLEALARQRGMPEIQISKLRQRISEIQSGRKSDYGANDNESRTRGDDIEDDDDTFFDDLIVQDTTETDQLPIFGSKIFESAFEFQPISNIATPENYILGPGDEVIIDIYGASEITYQQTISPEGKILIGGVGPISLGGISVKAAKNRAFNKLSSIYSGLKGSSPNTFMELSVGEIRTITVNVVGNVKRPGTYALSSFSSAFNALYQAGGPDKTGSMRQIDIVRNGEKIATLDIYRYFFEGDASGNPQLQDGDVVVVRTYANRVTFSGEVKQPAIYEFLPNETYEDLVDYSGGANAIGYDEKVSIFRTKGKTKSLVTVDSTNRAKTNLLDGDSISISPVFDQFTDRVEIKGAVMQPGYYQLKKAKTLSKLVELANGFSPDVFLNRGVIIRQNPDLTLTTISFSPQEIINNSTDIELQAEDIVDVRSLFDLREKRTVSIEGEVQEPDDYEFSEGMSVEDLIFMAKGFKESASKSTVEVARRNRNQEGDVSQKAEIFSFPLSENLTLSGDDAEFELEPYDLIVIRESIANSEQEIVAIEGEVLFPGKYALKSKTERISDLIMRAGGFTNEAFTPGGSLIRQTEYFDEGTAALVKKLRIQGLGSYDSTAAEGTFSINQAESIAIELDKIISSPRSKEDLILKKGDVISVPKELQTVRVRGEVYFSSNVIHQKEMSLVDYVSQSGGFTDKARKKKSYVVYANGSAARTKNFLGFKNYPKVDPGTEIIIPRKPDRRKLSTGEILGITSGLASLSLVVLQIINITTN